MRVLFDTHAGPLHDGAKLLARKRAAMEDLGVRVADLRARAWTTAPSTGALFPSKPLISFVSRGEWASLRMVQTVPAPEAVSRDGG